jgi:hypothetical protein
MNTPPNLSKSFPDPDLDQSPNMEAQLACPEGSGIFQLPPVAEESLKPQDAPGHRPGRVASAGREFLKNLFDQWR